MLTYFIPESLTYLVPLFLKRQWRPDPRSQEKTEPPTNRLQEIGPAFVELADSLTIRGAAMSLCGAYSRRRRSHFSHTPVYFIRGSLYRIYRVASERF